MKFEFHPAAAGPSPAPPNCLPMAELQTRPFSPLAGKGPRGPKWVSLGSVGERSSCHQSVDGLPRFLRQLGTNLQVILPWRHCLRCSPMSVGPQLQSAWTSWGLCAVRRGCPCRKQHRRRCMLTPQAVAAQAITCAPNGVPRPISDDRECTSLCARTACCSPVRSPRRRSCYAQARSKRSRSITFVQDATKSCTNFFWASALA